MRGFVQARVVRLVSAFDDMIVLLYREMLRMSRAAVERFESV